MGTDAHNDSYAALFAALPTAVFIIKEGRLERVNAAFAELLGKAPDELHGTPITELIAPEHRELVVERYRSRLAGEDVPANYEFNLLRRDGSRLPVTMEARVAELGGERVTIGTITDIREQRRAKQLLAAVARGAPIVISAYDRDGVFELQTGRGLEKLGLAEDQLVGQSVFDAFAGADAALTQIRAALAGETTYNTQDLGESIWDNWFIPLRDLAGEVSGALSISTDVTDRERTRAELQRRIEIIEAQTRAIRSMAAPIIQVWADVLVLPIVGELDRERAAEMTERLLSELAARQARHVILDLTGVEAIDSDTAGLLLRVLAAAQLLGVNGQLSGIRPDVAQALVSAGIDLSRVSTAATLHDGLRRCMAAS
ncbi:MAG: PAS domain S-box protein [Myxococcales bacterium]|nr:PAS domain S-box protein [Myxococcales bacterium]MCB9749387.1 PAS domain S-box protein [Myxococcales bacterium]